MVPRKKQETKNKIRRARIREEQDPNFLHANRLVRRDLWSEFRKEGISGV